MRLFLLFIISTAFLKLQILIFFIKTFKYKAIDIKIFFPIIDAEYIYYFTTYYETYLKFWPIIINNVCCYYGMFVWLLLLAIILDSNFIIIVALNNYIINLTCFNHYNQKFDKYYFIVIAALKNNFIYLTDQLLWSKNW